MKKCMKSFIQIKIFITFLKLTDVVEHHHAVHILSTKSDNLELRSSQAETTEYPHGCTHMRADAQTQRHCNAASWNKFTEAHKGGGAQ